MTDAKWKDSFECQQCGRCCTFFNDAYEFSVHLEDLNRWRNANRTDILKWVRFMEVQNSEGNNQEFIGADAWINPLTGDDVRSCPWLKRIPNQDIFQCKIHNLKPSHCRNFPIDLETAKKINCKAILREK